VASAWLTDVGALIDRDADVAVGVQLAWGIRAAIDAGRIRPGERLPPAREVAAAAGVNVNTLRSVFARLEREGYLVARHGSGTFVSDAPPRQPAVDRALDDATRAAASSGVQLRDLSSALYVAAAAPEPDAASQRRRALRQDLAALDRILAELRAKHADVDLSAAPLPSSHGPRIQSAEELEDLRRAMLRQIALLVNSDEDDDEPPPAVAKKPAKRRRPATKPAVDLG
jgi:DNA-binding FadR family transcriptional regulator